MINKNNKLNVGIIGCGVIGKIHAEAVAGNDQARLWAIADPRSAAIEEVLATHAVTRSYPSSEDLIHDPDVDAVILALPTAVRTPIALAALRAGKHVLLEKPPAMNVDELLELKANKGDRVVACASSRMRHFTHAQKATQHLRDSPIAGLRQVRIRGVSKLGAKPASPPPSWRLRRDLNGGGILANWGVYDLDYMLGILDWQLEPESMFAVTWGLPEQFSDRAAPGSDAEIHVVASIRCKGGTVISLERGELLTAESENTWEIIGETASLRLPMVADNPKQLIRYDASNDGAIPTTIWEGDEDPDDVHYRVVADFVEAIIESRSPATDLDNAIIIQRLLDGIIRSAETGRTIRWKETLPCVTHS